MKRIVQLDGVRAIAVLAVFLHHAFKIQALWIGVDLFFVLSGFLITGVLLDAKQQPLGHYFAYFYNRRVRRILPPYMLLLLAGTLFTGVGWLHYWYFYVLGTNFILPLHVPHPEAFDPLWSLAVEEQFYLVWPLIVYFLSARNLRWFAGFLVVLAPLLRGAFHFSDMWPVYTLTPFRMDLLAVGALLCLQWRSDRAIVERWGAKIGLAMIPVGLAIPFILHRWFVPTDLRMAHPVIYYEANVITCLGMMLYALSGWKVEWLKIRPLLYIGQISYSMYLVHDGVLLLLRHRIHGFEAAAAGFVITVAYSAISWKFMEGPLLGRRKRSPTKHLKPASRSGKVTLVRLLGGAHFAARQQLIDLPAPKDVA
jgi:peptidoglycan/LPS O-acetylase OafA/YrhL